MSTRKILVVDDEPEMTALLSSFLTAKKYTVFTAHTGAEALPLFDKEQPDIVFLDIRMPGMDGLEVLETIRKRSPQARVVMITAFEDAAVRKRARALGAEHFIPKPFSLFDLERELNL